mgnify:CR=1 FL=1
MPRQLADVSRSLMVAFSAVILAMIAAAITYTVVHVRRRWYAVELLAIARGRDAAAQEEPEAANPSQRDGAAVDDRLLGRR